MTIGSTLLKPYFKFWFPPPDDPVASDGHGQFLEWADWDIHWAPQDQTVNNNLLLSQIMWLVGKNASALILDAV